MELQEFIASIEPEFEEIDPGTLKENTVFREVEGWSSMIALILIARIEDEYGVAVSADELAGVKMIGELHHLVNNKL